MVKPVPPAPLAPPPGRPPVKESDRLRRPHAPAPASTPRQPSPEAGHLAYALLGAQVVK